jgi:SDR family mycofactocin-dependent oxidoreductase
LGKLEGKTAFITGAARGQGRAHAVRLASEGANIIAVDICNDIATIPYSMGTRAELDETCRLVEKEGTRASAQVADVRDRRQLGDAFDAGIEDVGVRHADIIVANAGGCAYPSDVDEGQAFRDAIDVMLVGAWNTVEVSTPALIQAATGGSVVLTSSTAALKGFTGGWGGLDGYTAAKAGLVGLMRVFANELAAHNIRVNTIHPTGVNTGMVQNEAFANWVGKASAEPLSNLANKLPDVGVIEPADVANAVAWLVSDEGRYVTGVALPVDAGFCNA